MDIVYQKNAEIVVFLQVYGNVNTWFIGREIYKLQPGGPSMVP